MYAMRKATTLPKITTTIRIRWSFLGVASGFVEALAIGVVDMVADDMVYSNDAVLLSALSSTNPV